MNIKQARLEILEITYDFNSILQSPKTVDSMRELLIILATEPLPDNKFIQAFNQILSTMVSSNDKNDIPFMKALNTMWKIKTEYLTHPNDAKDLEAAFKEIEALVKMLRELNRTEGQANINRIIAEGKLTAFLEIQHKTIDQKVMLIDFMIMVTGEAGNRDNSGILTFISLELQRIKTAYNLM